MLTLPLSLNYGAPVNWAHPLNRGLGACLKVLPLRYGGVRWLDLAGRNHGTCTGMGASSGTNGWGATVRRGGPGEVRFNGTTGYVSIPVLDTPAVTMACWVKGRTWTPAYTSIIASVNLPTGYRQLLVRSDGKLAGYVWTTADVSVDPATTVLATNTWYHLALTYDSTSGLKLYINGVQDGSAAANGTLAATGAATLLGNDAGTAGRFLAGSMDDVRLYNRALDATDVKALYRESQKPMTPLLNYMALPFGRTGAKAPPPMHRPLRIWRKVA